MTGWHGPEGGTVTVTGAGAGAEIWGCALGWVDELEEAQADLKQQLVVVVALEELDEAWDHDHCDDLGDRRVALDAEQLTKPNHCLELSIGRDKESGEEARVEQGRGSTRQRAAGQVHGAPPKPHHDETRRLRAHGQSAGEAGGIIKGTH